MPKRNPSKSKQPPSPARPERGADGRFAPGWRGGPGNPNVRHNAEIQAAVRDAVDPATLRGVMRKLAIRALEGDVAAAKVLLDRVCGKARPELPDHSFELLPVRAAADLPAAFEQVMHAAAAGDIAIDEATRLGGLLELARRAIETSELAQRLERLEDHVQATGGLPRPG